jgi:hypothetical protein
VEQHQWELVELQNLLLQFRSRSRTKHALNIWSHRSHQVYILFWFHFDKWLSTFLSIDLANELLHVIGWRQTTGWYQQLPRWLADDEPLAVNVYDSLIYRFARMTNITVRTNWSCPHKIMTFEPCYNLVKGQDKAAESLIWYTYISCRRFLCFEPWNSRAMLQHHL